MWFWSIMEFIIFSISNDFTEWFLWKKWFLKLDNIFTISKSIIKYFLLCFFFTVFFFVTKSLPYWTCQFTILEVLHMNRYCIIPKGKKYWPISFEQRNIFNEFLDCDHLKFELIYCWTHLERPYWLEANSSLKLDSLNLCINVFILSLTRGHLSHTKGVASQEGLHSIFLTFKTHCRCSGWTVVWLVNVVHL